MRSLLTSILLLIYSQNPAEEGIDVISQQGTNKRSGYVEYIVKDDQGVDTLVDEKPLLVSPVFVANKAGGSHCYIASVSKKTEFRSATTVHVPTLNSSTVFIFNGRPFTLTINAQIKADAKTHEDWHAILYKAYLDSVWTALEQWVNAYKSNRFADANEAKAAAESDYAKALVIAESFVAKYKVDRWGAVDQDGLTDHDKSYLRIDGNGNFSMNNPDWGAAALAKIKLYKPEYEKIAKTRGTCK